MTKNKTNTFSIYLLKDQFNATNGLKHNHNLIEIKDATNLPKGASLFLGDNKPKEPWWKAYWGVNNDLEQSLKSAIAFIPIDSRCFAITFGHAYHKLKNESIEYNFGLITSLNALDPNKIRTADIASPETAMQYRSQSPVIEHWTYFDVMRDDSIIKNLKGKVLPQYQDIFNNVSGSDSFRFSSKCTPDDLPKLCEKLLSLYLSNQFKQHFPDILNVIPIKDPNLLDKLNENLIYAFHNRSIELVFTLPEIANIDISGYTYRGKGVGEIYDDLYIDNYRDYLDEKGIHYTSVSIEDLQKNTLAIMDAEKEIKKTYPIYSCMLFDCEIDGKHYHLFDGQWFEIEKDYLTKLKNELDRIFIQNTRLIACEHKDEEDYNKNAAKVSNLICLDRANISVCGRDKIEPCDLLYIEGDKVNLVHIKVSTRSSALSHLFRQGVNSLEVLRLEQESKNKLKELLKNHSEIIEKIEQNQYSLTYGIITAKNANMKSSALPIFSRISLMAALRQCWLLGVECSVVLIEDKFDRSKSKSKKK